MGFVQASMLAALAAVVLPVIVHLIFRRRSRPVDLGTLRFLKIAVRLDARRRRLKRLVLLALRVGCVVFAAFLFARPYRAEPQHAGHSGLTVVLLDRSASMARLRDGVRLVDHAVQKLPEITARVPAGAKVEVAWFDSKVEPVGDTASGRSPVAGVTAPAALTGGTDFAAAMTWAAARCDAARDGGGPLAVHVVTDLQRTGFGSLEAFAFPKDVPVRVWDVGPAPAANIAVTEVRPLSLMVPADQPTTIRATVLNARPDSLEQRPVQLKLSNQGKTLTVPAMAKAAPGSVANVSFETPPLTPGLWQGTVSVAGEDGFPLDDARHVAVFAAAKPRVLLLDGAAHEVAVLGETYLLEAALRLAPPGESNDDSPFHVTLAPYESGARLPDLRDMDVLVVANVASFSPGDAARIKAFLDRGGSAVVFGGNNLKPESAAGYSAAGLSLGELGGTLLARDLPFRIAEFVTDHPVLIPFADPQHGDLNRLTFSGCTRVTPAAGVRVLARFQDGRPLILERPTSPRVLWCAASVGNEHGAWSRSRLFLPLVHQLVKGAAGIAGAGPVVDLPAAGEEPGVRKRGDGWDVRNLEPQESELESCTPEEFARRLGLTRASGETASPATTEEDALEQRYGELWPWLWLLLVICWLAEGLLADRTVA
jgi:hypothetical protein